MASRRAWFLSVQPTSSTVAVLSELDPAKLSEEEKAAIRWHMGIHTKDAFEIYNYDYQTASSQSVLVKLIHDADSKSAKLDKE